MKIEKIERVAQAARGGWYRLPELPGAGALMVGLKKAHLGFLEQIFPEDFYQEAAAFLLAWNSKPVDKEFFRAAGRHFYRFAVDYGYKRPRGSSRYERLEGSFDHGGPDEEWDSGRNPALAA